MRCVYSSESYRWSRGVLYYFTLIISTIFLAQPTHAAGRPTIEHLVGFFETVVFGSEIDDRLKYPILARWTGPLRINVKGDASPEHIESIKSHLTIITKLTGIPIEKIEAPEKPENLTILFLPALEMGNVEINGVDPEYIRKLSAPRSCYFISFKYPPDSIIRSVIVVNSQRSDEEINHCLLEELVQSMGLPNDTDMLRPSIFSDHDRLSVLSRSDEILIRTLYDGRMTEGLEKASALRVAREIIEDWDRRLPTQ